MARELGAELVGIESPLDSKTGSSSGWIQTETYEHFAGRMLAGLAAAGPFDGVYLSLHGAMGVRGVPRPEADLARRVRDVVGRDPFIAGTFDPHGNEDGEFLRHADFAFCAKYYPHYDSYLQGERAARQLVRAIRGEYRPTSVTLKVPILTATVRQWTGASPWLDLVQRALIWEGRRPDVFVNVFFGFPWADVPDVGMTVQVAANDDPDLARAVAEDMAGTAWLMREGLVGAAEVHTVARGVELAAAAVADGAKPVVLADHSDRSGAATWVLREVLARGLARTLIATVADPEAVAQELEPGAPFELAVGGRQDESAGEPVRVQGTVLGRGTISGARGPLERAGEGSWLAVGFGEGSVLVLSDRCMQLVDPSQLRVMELDPADFDVIALKSRVHFRRGFADTGFAKTILVVEPEAAFLGTVRLDALQYENVDLRDFYPYGAPAFP
jgi:microcystin degradation protein MlrC